MFNRTVTNIKDSQICPQSWCPKSCPSVPLDAACGRFPRESSVAHHLWLFIRFAETGTFLWTKKPAKGQRKSPECFQHATAKKDPPRAMAPPDVLELPTKKTTYALLPRDPTKNPPRGCYLGVADTHPHLQVDPTPPHSAPPSAPRRTSPPVAPRASCPA